MGFEVLHGIVDCLWVIGELISKLKEAVEMETGILTEVDIYDWITFLLYRRYMDELGDADVRELAVHRRVSRLNYSRRSAELVPAKGQSSSR